MDANFGPAGSLAITFRWAKNLILSIFSFILAWSIIAPKETSKVLREVGFGQFEEFVINENLPVALIREFFTDAFFAILGFTSYWMIARYTNNASTNPVILFLRVFGLETRIDSRSLPENEKSIVQGYQDLLSRIKSSKI